MRNEDVRPRAIVISSQHKGWGWARDIGTYPQCQANVNTFS
jgi:hypothetical protein